MGVLSSLWEALEVEQEDVDRGIFARLMSGPARLHGKSIQKVLATHSKCQLVCVCVCVCVSWCQRSCHGPQLHPSVA